MQKKPQVARSFETIGCSRAGAQRVSVISTPWGHRQFDQATLFADPHKHFLKSGRVNRAVPNLCLDQPEALVFGDVQGTKPSDFPNIVGSFRP